MKPFVSLCMIVKNEETVIRRCLESVFDIVDEIIVLDTGSTDKTVTIAKEYTDKIYHTEWNNDFSEARNKVQSFANGEWILYLDADEYVESAKLRESLRLLEEDTSIKHKDALIVTQVNFVGDLGSNISYCPTARLYKNNGKINFKRAVHEQLYRNDTLDLELGSIELNIYHSGYLNSVSQEKDKFSRNTSIINKELNQNSNAFDYFNLGNEYISRLDYNRALSYYKEAYMKKPDINFVWVPMVVERMIFSLISLKRYDDALIMAKEASGIWDTAVDFKTLEALVYFNQSRFLDAEHSLLEVLEIEDHNFIQSANYLYQIPYLLLGRISEQKEDLVNAVKNYAKALNFNKHDVSAIKDLFKILLFNSPDEEIILFIKENNLIASELLKQIYIQTFISLGRSDLIWRLSEEFNIEISPGLEAKLLIINNKIRQDTIIDLNRLKEDPILDKYDLIIIAVKSSNNELFNYIKKHGNLLGLNDVNTIVTRKSLVEKNKKDIIKLLERIIVYRDFDLFEKIVKDITVDNYCVGIGNLLYSQGFKDVAMDFYSRIKDMRNLDDKSSLNIIETLYNRQQFSDALNFLVFALDNNYRDFKLFKIYLDLLKQLNDFNSFKGIYEKAVSYFPDSIELKQIHF